MDAEGSRMPVDSLAERIPKIHLHCHLEGCLRAATFVELAAKNGVPLRYSRSRADESSFDGTSDPYRFKDLDEFLLLFAAVSRSLRDPRDYARLAREFVEDALQQNVIYGELFVSPPVWTFFNPALDVRATLEAIAAELRAARPRATFSLLCDLTRNFGSDDALETVRKVAGMTKPMGRTASGTPLKCCGPSASDTASARSRTGVPSRCSPSVASRSRSAPRQIG
jgi:adenosine deaminase